MARNAAAACTLLIVAALLFAAIRLFDQPGTATGGEPLVETFDGAAGTLSAALLDHGAISFAQQQGVAETAAIKVTYDGYPRGSRRVIVSHPLSEPSLEATLSYDVRFCDGFRFVKGGKLHGLGPEKPAAGGRAFSAEQWSARVIFLGNAGIGAYLYHQDLAGRYGEATVARSFKFEPGRFYTVSLRVRLNDPPEIANGFALITVDGEELVRHENIRFRDTGGESTLIDKLLFNTFHGGHTADFAPRDENGFFTKECAYFDNIGVLRAVPAAD